jgi:hypothetical protein
MTKMKRRDFVKAMVAASVSANSMFGQQAGTPVTPSTPPLGPPAAPPAIAPGPVPWMSGLMEVKPLPMTPLVPDAVAQTNSHFFNVEQMATLRRLGELLLPPLKGYPGAKDAAAPEFLDFLIGASPADRQQLYISGLDRLNADSKKRFDTSFATTNKAQADELLRPLLTTWMTDHPPSDPYIKFVNIAHSDIRTATINSQAWSKAARADGEPTPEVGLYWFPVDPDLQRNNLAVAASHGKRSS